MSLPRRDVQGNDGNVYIELYRGILLLNMSKGIVTKLERKYQIAISQAS